MKYETVEPLTRAEAELQLATSDIEALPQVVAALYLVDDSQWVIDQLHNLLEHPDKWVAGTAIMGFADLARVGVSLDTVTLEPLLLQLGQQRRELMGRVSSALEDIELFIGPKSSA